MTTRKNQLPSRDQLRELLTPDFEKGTLRWAADVNVRRHRVIGTPAGYPDPSKDGRVVVGLKGRRYFRYHILWILYHGSDPWPLVIDHIDRDPTNDAINNLRAVTPQRNVDNKDFLRKKRIGEYGVGVKRRKRGNSVRFHASIEIERKRISLGYFATAEEAGRAYQNARSARLRAVDGAC